MSSAEIMQQTFQKNNICKSSHTLHICSEFMDSKGMIKKIKCREWKAANTSS